MKKRITSFVMALIMLVSLLPLEAIALTTDENGVSVFEMGDSVWAKAGETPAGATAEGTAWYQVYDENDNVVTKQGLCDKTEHTHNYNCVECTAAHTHTDECYTTVYGCGLEANAGHAHGNACYEKVCTLEETAGHVHGETCSDANGNLTCTVAEGTGAHAHVAECYNLEKLVCTTEIGAGAHAHTEECAPATSLTCEIAEHVCVTDGCAADCAAAEHTHTAECDMETTYVKWEVTAEMALMAPGRPGHNNVETWEDAEEVYADTTNFGHVDIRVNGSITINSTTIAIKVVDPSVTIVDGGNTYTYSDVFSGSETYEWRINRSVSKSAVITIVFDVYVDADGDGAKDDLLYADYTATYSGYNDFVQAILDCDGGQGLDFRIDETEIEDKVLPDLTVKKVDENGNALAGATFTLAKDGTVISTKTAGTATFSNLEAGSYVLTETAAPAGYTAGEPIRFTVELNTNATQKVVSGHTHVATYYYNIMGLTSNTVNVTNTKKIGESVEILPDLTVKKVDESGNALEGAVFTATSADGLTVTATSDADGIATFEKLAPGSYTLTETQAPAGYIKSDASVEFTVAAAGEPKEELVNGEFIVTTTYEVTGLTTEQPVFTNTMKTTTEKVLPSLTVKKVNNYGEALEGATFTATLANGGSVDATSGADGIATFEKLAPGSYTLTETQAPAGYTKSDASYTFEVIKVEQVTSKEPNADGYFVITETYEIRNLKLNGEDTDGIEIVNTKNVGTEEILPELTVNKVDQDGKALSGATFQLVGKDAEGKTVYSKTENAGTATFKDLVAGSYTLTETEAPAGYTAGEAVTFSVVEASSEEKLDEDTNTFITTITYEIQGLAENTVEVTNTKNIGEDVLVLPDLTVNKLDQDGEALSGATFQLVGVKGETEVYNKTLSAGTALFEKLVEGDYTLTETVVPAGYIGTEPVTFSVVETGKEENLVGNEYITTITYAIEGVAENTIDVVNTQDTVITHKPASFKIQKVDQDGKALNGAVFALTAPDGTTETKEITENGIIEFTGLKGGDDGKAVEYTLVETAAPAGYAKSTSEWTITVKDKNNGEVVLELNKEKNVFENIWDWIVGNESDSEWNAEAKTLTVTNTIIPGTLTVNKVFEGLEDKSVQVTVNGPSIENETVTFTAENATKTWENVLPGEYTITEDAESAAENNYVWTMTVEGAEETEADYTYTVEVPMATTEPGSAEVTITNSYTPYIPTFIKIQKVGVYKGETTNLAGATFQLTGPNGYDETVTTDSNGAAEFADIMAQGEYTLKETAAPEGYLENAREYKFWIRLVEQNVDVPYYEVVDAQAPLFGEGDSFVYTTEEGEAANIMTVANTPITGSITITKDFEYDVAEGFEVEPEEITVTVDGEDYTLNAENEWTVTVDNLLPGEYTITEDTESAMFQGYTLGVTYNGKETGVIEVPEQNGAVVEMAIVNTYTQEFNEDEHIPASFVVYKEDKDGKALAGAEFTLYNEEGKIVQVVTTAINEEGKAVAEFNNLYGIKETKEAVTYTLKETAAPAGYTPIDTEWTVIVEEDDGEVRIEIEKNADKFDKFWNWILGEGSDVDGVLVVENEQTVLTINTDLAYTLNGVASEKLDGMEVPETEYTYTVTYKVGEEDKSVTVTAAEGEQEKVYGIPVGAAYTITVDTTADYFDSTVAYETRSGMMPESGVTEADVLHTYNYFTVGAEKIVEVVGEAPEKFVEGWKETEYVVMLVVGNGVEAQLRLKEADGVKYFDAILLKGTDYEVIEVAAEDEIVTYASEVGEPKDNVVTVTNTYTVEADTDLLINMIKTSYDKKTALQGAKFTLKDSNNYVMDGYVSAKDGTFVIDAISKPGTYTLTETEAPKGYYKLNKAITITVEYEDDYLIISEDDAGNPVLIKELVVKEVKNGKVEEVKEDGIVTAYRVKNVEITDNAKTGDQMNLVLWVGMGGAAAAALVILLILGKKRAR